MPRGSSRWTLLPLVLVLAAVAGCASPMARQRVALVRLLASQEENRQRWFLGLLRSNGAEDAFRAALSRWPFGPRRYEVELVRTMPGSNGLVYVQVRPDPDRVPGMEDPAIGEPERLWFFFDPSGNLLTWSDNLGGTWLLEDVTDDGIKDLLVSRPKGLGPPQEPQAGPVCYTLFPGSRPGAAGITFGRNFYAGTSDGFTLIHLCDSSIPLVMTLEDRNPCEHPLEEKRRPGATERATGSGLPGEKEQDGWFGTVVRTFKGGEPRVILVVPDYLELITNPGGGVVLRPGVISASMDKKYQLNYNFGKRKFEVEWLEEDECWNPVDFSAQVPP